MIRLVTPKIQELVDLEFAKLADQPEASTALDQVGLNGGDKIVYEYLDHGEAGLAFEHLRYMVYETGIELAPDIQEALEKISNSLG